MFQVYSVPRPGTIASISRPCEIERAQVLADRAVVVEPHARR